MCEVTELDLRFASRDPLMSGTYDYGDHFLGFGVPGSKAGFSKSGPTSDRCANAPRVVSSRNWSKGMFTNHISSRHAA